METIHTLDDVVVEAIPPRFALYPYGAFTSFVMVDGTVLGWRAHVDRLATATAELWDHDLDRGRVADRVRHHVGFHGDSPISVRVTVYPDTFTIAAPEKASGCRILVSSTPTRFPAGIETTFSVRSIEYTRTSPHLKTTDLFTQIALRRDARLAGFDDALLTVGDTVLEGSTWSVMVWSDGKVLTPDSDVLPGTTVETLTGVAATLGWSLGPRMVRRHDLLGAQLVLGVSVNHPARAISRVDGTDLNVDVELLEALAEAFDDLPRDHV